MNTVQRLMRADLHDFSGYASARSKAASGTVWLNANESAYPNASDGEGACRRYPDPQPAALRARLAKLYEVAESQLLIGRGSDEGIDLLLRAFCPPGQGGIVIAPPVFGMYAVCARLHGARITPVPLLEGTAGFSPDLEAMADAARSTGAQLLFVCRPGNPTGEVPTLEAIVRLAAGLAGRCMVVVDEAYIEYADAASATTLLTAHDNVVVLRTLSKAHALAGAVIASADAIAVLRRCQAPYPLPQPVVGLALGALEAPALGQTRRRVAKARRERGKLARALRTQAGVRAVQESQANFVLVRFDDADGALAALLAAGIVVRDMRAMPQLGDALRISIGMPSENRAVLRALAARTERAA